MTVIAIHAPHLELRRDESFSLREASEQKAFVLACSNNSSSMKKEKAVLLKTMTTTTTMTCRATNLFVSVFNQQLFMNTVYLSRKNMTRFKKRPIM
jgi:hypothetical protein